MCLQQEEPVQCIGEFTGKKLSVLISQSSLYSLLTCHAKMWIWELSLQLQKEKVQDYFGTHRHQDFAHLATL